MPAGTFVVPAPVEVDAVMRKVPKGRLITVAEVREVLAQKHGANSCCPLTADIFAWISAHAAEEARSEGRKRVTPYWRTLKAKGELNPNCLGGVDTLKAHLEAEGTR